MTATNLMKQNQPPRSTKAPADSDMIMDLLILAPRAIPRTLFRVQHVDYYIPPSAPMDRGIYAPNPHPSTVSSMQELAEEVENHLGIVRMPDERPFQSQWLSPFLTVFSQREDAENFLKRRGEHPGDKEWVIFEVSGAEIGARGGEVLPLGEVTELNNSAAHFLIWRTIPREALVASWEWRVNRGGVISRQRTLNVRLQTRQTQAAPMARSISKRAEERSESSDEQHLPADYHEIKSVVEHYPSKSNVTTAKWYKVCWEGAFDDDWRLTEDVTEEAIDAYWEGKAKQKKKGKTANQDDE